jgi:hypothetical protein
MHEGNVLGYHRAQARSATALVLPDHDAAGNEWPKHCEVALVAPDRIVLSLVQIVPYTNILFELDLKFSGLTSIMVASIIQVAWAVFTTAGMFTIERWGRRPTLMVGTVICTIG